MPEPESFIKKFNKRFDDTIGIIAPKKEKLINLICSKKKIFYVCFFAFKKITLVYLKKPLLSAIFAVFTMTLFSL